MQTRSDNRGIFHVPAVCSVCAAANSEYDGRYDILIVITINYFVRLLILSFDTRRYASIRSVQNVGRARGFIRELRHALEMSFDSIFALIFSGVPRLCSNHFS